MRDSGLRRALGLAAVGAVLALGAAGSGAAPAADNGKAASRAALAGCGAFTSQADAQAYFLAQGGDPNHPRGGLDGDRDGVACEGSPAPYVGFGTVGYNKKRDFFYGYVTMPPAASGGFACLYGNRFELDGPRRFKLYRVLGGPRPDVAVGDGYFRASADPASGRLAWKVEAPQIPGRYYAEFEDRIRATPYGKNECPGFRSQERALPTFRND